MSRASELMLRLQEGKLGTCPDCGSGLRKNKEGALSCGNTHCTQYNTPVSEGYHEPTDQEKEKFKKAAAGFIQQIKDRKPDFEDTDGEIENAFLQNMIKLTRGDYRE